MGVIFDQNSFKDKLKELENLIGKENFWDNNQKAQDILKEKNFIEKIINEHCKLNSIHNDLNDFMNSLEKEYDEDLYIELKSSLKSLKKNIKSLEANCYLSNESDKFDCFLEVHAGAGGTESQDWVQMLYRMYGRWAEQKGFEFSIIDFQAGDEAGIKDVTFEIKGEYAYGLAKAEFGVHRMVRISPFDSNSRRHTSFASVYIYPSVDESIEIDINPSDIRIDTYRASGAGGQHVNKTDSAVRITHIPSGVVAQCQNERSQHKNKNQAMKLLKARLYQLEIDKEKEKQKNLEDKKKDIAWGSQIRSYVFHPYNLVKDHRTKEETGNIQAVMDGNLDPFIKSYLLEQMRSGT